MHRVLRVVAVHGDELRSIRVCTGLTGHRCALGVQVPQEPLAGQARHETISVRDKLGPGCSADHDLVVGDEQGQQHRGVSRCRESAPLPCRVHDDIEVPGTGAVGNAPGLVPHRVPLVLLERNCVGLRARAGGHPGQPGDELRGLEAYPHLVAVVLPGNGRPVDA